MTLAPVRWWDVAEPGGAGGAGCSTTTPGARRRGGASLARHDTRTYLLQRDDAGRVEGYAGLSVQGGDADVMTIAVAPDAQGRGLGRRLLAALVDHAARVGATQAAAGGARRQRRGAAALRLGRVRADRAAPGVLPRRRRLGDAAATVTGSDQC
nr:GNAT family N-acetyltransferase [Angustibacter aerolatus]